MVERTETSGLKEKFSGSVRSPIQNDLADIAAIVSESAPKAAEHVRSVVEESLTGKNDVRYIVAEDNEKIVGLMGYRPLLLGASGTRREDVVRNIMQFATGNRPVELINVYVLSRMRRKGVGGTLLREIERLAHTDGYDELLLASGNAAKGLAWGFYNENFGPPVHSDDERSIWRKKITS